MKKLIIWECSGAVFVIIAGSLLHFLYSGTHYWLFAWFSPVNESVWEHLKIAIWPIFVFAVIEYPFIKSSTRNFMVSKVAQAYTTCAAVLIIFYAYTAVLGHNMLPLDILTFVIAVVIGQYVSFKLITLFELDEFADQAALYALYALIGFTLYVTYLPPHYPAFMDPITGEYGIQVHRNFLDNIMFFSKNTLLGILIVLLVFLVMNFTTPFRIWSLNRKMDRIISLLEKIAKK